uniref:Uncharacterized protein n=1 Tax=Rhizophora mucronata TaxID=61149 RepID=A0A2P2QZV6_RHIMU
MINPEAKTVNNEVLHDENIQKMYRTIISHGTVGFISDHA